MQCLGWIPWPDARLYYSLWQNIFLFRVTSEFLLLLKKYCNSPCWNTMDSPVTPCRRCKQPSIVVIRRVPLCQDCFTNFIGGKLGKRLAEYAKSDFVGAGSRSYLLPISF